MILLRSGVIVLLIMFTNLAISGNGLAAGSFRLREIRQITHWLQLADDQRVATIRILPAPRKAHLKKTFCVGRHIPARHDSAARAF
jgi:hypothetical protein